MYTKFDMVRNELFNFLQQDCKVSLLVGDAWYDWNVVVLLVTENTVWLYRNPTPTQQGQRVEVPLAWVMAVTE